MSKKDITEWQAVNNVTGEVLSLDQFQAKNHEHWERTRMSMIEKMYKNGADNISANVVSYFLKNKDIYNRVYNTQKEIADKLKTTEQTVNKVIKKLVKHGHIKQIRSGYYVVNPDITHFGNDFNKFKILGIWNGVQ